LRGLHAVPIAAVNARTGGLRQLLEWKWIDNDKAALVTNTNRFFALALMLMAVVAQGQTVYRSVDDQGRVTYSSEPPEGARASKEIRIEPGPSEAQRQEALDRQRRLLEQSAEAGAEREQSRAQRAAEIQQAEEELRAAREALEQARVKRERDWQGRAGGGHRLKESYFERVRAAEQAVDAAEKRLDHLKLGG
jgi:hypothetical protein